MAARCVADSASLPRRACTVSLEKLSAKIVSPHEIHPRSFVPIYGKLQHGPEENIRKNPARASQQRGTNNASDRKCARQCFADCQKDGSKPVKKRRPLGAT